MFDLDETLIHCNETTDVPSDVILPISFPSGDIIDVNCFFEVCDGFGIGWD